MEQVSDENVKGGEWQSAEPDIKSAERGAARRREPAVVVDGG